MRLPEKLRPLVLAGVLGVLVVIGTLGQSSSSPSGLGKEWSIWTPSERRVFVAAYLDGYLRGKTDACVAAGELFEQQKPIADLEETPDRKCFHHAKGYSRTADDYEAIITAFYAKDKKYEEIPVEYLMLLLTNARYQSSSDIEEGMRKGGSPTPN
jgi:hypothetical protein